ncbi:penicillin-binding protein 1A [Kangiella sp. HZ709]|uniref:penicillin-binding protein 1A n=1 Tax=Kangiella sp. HZ709 TaxID=2666328 RepID=UPI0012AF26E6|nr:penicillin-binding protein 1A [Kangiella sp. HZ709]MRX27649.1 PBP1A family penicillin-binding protein [Kangiella sp. HZ709]
MKITIYILKKITLFVSLLTIFGVMVVLGAYLYSAPQLPTIASLKNIQLQTPMRIFTADKKLIGEFGDVRRIPVTLEQVPENFVNALIATEDKRFREHSGVDLLGILRVIKVALTTQEATEGASTLTMQTARNMFLNRDKRLKRKLIEMFLALKMEQELSKDEILELYTNKVHFSHRAYGLGAAAQVYYGKDVTELDLPQAAMMAGLLKGESAYNPISNPERALNRRNLVLSRMLSENYITEDDYQLALETPLTATKHTADLDLNAPYVAEMVRLDTLNRFGREQAYTQGLEIYTTIDSKQQMAATQALRQGLLDYDRRHGYKGPELVVENFDQEDKQALTTLLSSTPSIGGLEPAIVTQVSEQSIEVINSKLETIIIDWSGLDWAAKFISDTKIGNKPKKASEIVGVGSLIRIIDAGPKLDKKGNIIAENQWQLSQVPEAVSGFVALKPKDGAVTALVGGFDYLSNKFNLVTQARRQPGSNIKPFIYAAALNKGFTPASLVNDAPFIKVNEAIDEVWRPQNDNLKYNGPTRLRVGLKRSINTISTRLIDAIGADYAEQYLVKVGLPDEHMDPYQSLALGTASFTPMEMAMAYAVLANGGYQVEPYFIKEVRTSDGDVLFETTPKIVCKECEQLIIERQLNADTPSPEIRNYPELPVAEEQIAQLVMDPRDAFIIYDMMKDVIKSGTATTTLKRRQSSLLKRNDLAGKTGTANDYKDAWFSGFNSELVGSAWMGFSDHRRSLGKFEYGGKAALPIWAAFMEQILAGSTEKHIIQPPGVVSAKIDPATGKLAAIGQSDGIFEYFRDDNVPSEIAQTDNNLIPEVLIDSPFDEEENDESTNEGSIF